MTLPLVSIGIPTFNRAHGYLKQTLESALGQTYPNLEIVVSDNCSTDGTESVVKGYADPRVRYVRQPSPLIPNDNFNFCLSQARGEYFLLLHDDDTVDPDFIEACLHAVDYKSGIGVIHAAHRVIDANGRVIQEAQNDVRGLSTADFFLAWIDGRTSLYLCSTLYNTRGLREIGGFRSKRNLFQDVAATVRLAATMGRTDIESVKASTRQHGGKWTHVARVREWCEDSAELLDLLCELAPARAPEIRRRGLPFFVRINYGRAGEIRSFVARMSAYALVYRFFGGICFPTAGMIFRSTGLYRGLRQVKRRLLGLPAWAD